MRFGSVRSASLGHSEAGYYLLVSRLGGVFASLVPIRAAALTMWIWTAVVVAWLVATVTVSSRSWLRTWPARIMVALAIVLLPVSGQRVDRERSEPSVPDAVCGARRPDQSAEEPSGRVNGGVILLATGFTTPLTAALLPFAIWRMVRARSLRPDPYVISWFVGVIAQWLAILLTRLEAAPPRRQPVGDRASTRSRGLSSEPRPVRCVPTSRTMARPDLCRRGGSARRLGVEARRA